MSDKKKDKPFIDLGFFTWTGEFSLLPTMAVIIYLMALVNGSISLWTLPLIFLYKMDFININLKKNHK